MHFINRFVILFLFYICLHKTYGKLVFPPGTDIGYIIPDNDIVEEDNIEATVPVKENIVGHRTKRQFWNTVFDDISGTNTWDQLQSLSETSIKKDSVNHEVKIKPASYGEKLPEFLKDKKHRVAMGKPNVKCDNAKVNLEVDWDGSPVSYTCYTPKVRLKIHEELGIVETCDNISPSYIPQHYCMNDSIHYNTSLPTFGPHRPLWPIFGEYNYVPTQRWLHSVEHGAIVMLYHPCTEPIMVNELKNIVKGCIYRHVIAASSAVSLERPMVLIGWGCKLELPFVDKEVVIKFIRKRALNGPEGTYSKQGQYSEELIEKSTIPEGSTIEDANLCPKA